MLDFDADLAASELRRKGYFIHEKAFDTISLGNLYSQYSRYIESGPTSQQGLGVTLNNGVLWIDHPLTISREMVNLAINPNIISSITRYLQCDINLSYSLAYRTLSKEGASGRLQDLTREPGVFKGWHSDANLSDPKRGYRFVVAMIYLTDVNPGDGGLWLVEGSHLYGGVKREWTHTELDVAKVREINAPAGSIILFDMEMIHRAGTPGNGRSRDIVRFMYSPLGGYQSQQLVPLNFIPKELDNQQMSVLGLGRQSSQQVSISPRREDNSAKQSIMNRITTFNRKLLRRFLDM